MPENRRPKGNRKDQREPGGGGKQLQSSASASTVIKPEADRSQLPDDRGAKTDSSAPQRMSPRRAKTEVSEATSARLDVDADAGNSVAGL